MKAKPFPPLNPDERAVVDDNLGLAGQVAKQFKGRGLDHDELVNEGVFGLAEAARRYDPAHTVDGEPIKFSTYAVYWIRQRIGNAVRETGATVRVPSWVYDHATKVRRLELSGHAAAVDFDELCDRAGVTVWDRPVVRKARKALAGASGLAFDTADDAGPDGGIELRDELAAMRRAVDTLPERDRRIIRMRFGLDGEPERSLKAVGETEGVTREYVRQVEKRALHRLKTHLEGAAGEARA